MVKVTKAFNTIKEGFDKNMITPEQYLKACDQYNNITGISKSQNQKKATSWIVSIATWVLNR